MIFMANCTSLACKVTLLAWMQWHWASSNTVLTHISIACCRHNIAALSNLSSALNPWGHSLTSLWKGRRRVKHSVLFWYLLTSLRATVPGLKRWGFLSPPVAGAVLRATLVVSCLRGAFPPVDLRAVCLVLAIDPM